MKSKEALERLLKYNNHYIKDKEYLFIDVESEEWKAILKDLEILEHIKVLVEKYNNDELHFTRGFYFINIVKEVLENDK